MPSGICDKLTDYRHLSIRLCCKESCGRIGFATTSYRREDFMENPLKWRHYESEIILLCVRWYLRYTLSYRDLEEMMSERGLSIVHTTIYRWVQAYPLEIDNRCRPHLKREKLLLEKCKRRPSQ